MDSSLDATGVVNLQLTADEALVLFEWIHRNEDESVDLASAGATHPAERTVLWDLSACLEATLVRPFSADYSSEIAAARFRVALPLEHDDLATPLES